LSFALNFCYAQLIADYFLGFDKQQQKRHCFCRHTVSAKGEHYDNAWLWHQTVLGD